MIKIRVSTIEVLIQGYQYNYGKVGCGDKIRNNWLHINISCDTENVYNIRRQGNIPVIFPLIS